jgi:hypothetical protein
MKISPAGVASIFLVLSNVTLYIVAIYRSWKFEFFFAYFLGSSGCFIAVTSFTAYTNPQTAIDSIVSMITFPSGILFILRALMMAYATYKGISKMPKETKA